MVQLTPEQLVGELEQLLATMPPRATIRHSTPENFAWFGKAKAILNAWSPVKAAGFPIYQRNLSSSLPQFREQGYADIAILLHQAIAEIRMETVGPVSVALGQGSVFDYFDNLRKIIELAKTDILFVDPYMDADFIADYLPAVSDGVTIRLLAKNKVGIVVAAARKFASQHNANIEVRTSNDIHDRYVFVDGQSAYQSGASFKDGGRKAATAIIQVVDGFPAFKATYEQLWIDGTIASP